MRETMAKSARKRTAREKDEVSAEAATPRHLRAGGNRDYDAIVRLLEKRGSPPPHPLTAHFRSRALIGSVAAPGDVVVPIIVRKQTGEIVDGLARCASLCAKGVPWADVPKRVRSLPTDADVAECLAQCNLERKHLNK